MGTQSHNPAILGKAALTGFQLPTILRSSVKSAIGGMLNRKNRL